MATEYISEVQLPGDSNYKKIKDAEARSLISNCQSNIWYVLGKTGKNFLDCSLDRLKAVNNEGTWNGNVYTVVSVGTVTINSDKTITVVKTGTSARLVFYLASNQEAAAISGDKFAGYILSGCPSGGSSTTYRLTGEEISSPWSTVSNDYGNGDTIQSSTLQVGFYISVHADYTTTGSGLTFKPMICTEEDWNVSPDHQPYRGLPNYDLTRLEAEDRAALAEEIDAGAKNLFDWSKADLVEALSVSNGVFTTTCTDSQTNLRFQLDGLNSSKAVVENFIINGATNFQVITTNGTYAFPFTMKSNIAYLRFGHNGSQQNGRGDINVQHLTAGKTYIFFINVTQCSSSTSTFKWQDTMICTKVAFGVSQKFVPYRPNMYDYQWQAISTYLLARRSGRTITINGYIANISFTANTATLIGNVNTTVGRPHESVRTLCNVGANAYTVGTLGYLILQQDGNIYVTTAYEGTGAVYVSLSYTI